VGLWLWDYQKSGKKDMVWAFRTRYKDNDELFKYEDADLRFFYRVTDECIKSRGVLPMTKKARELEI
jgi:hypothetical protein